MLDFQAAKDKQISFDELIAGLTRADLAVLTNEMVDTMLTLIRECDDDAATWQPVDESANDPYAEKVDDVGIAWTLGHVIVHATASAEEAAFVGAELARGVEYHGRSRYETPWESLTTIAQCRARLEESRRMRLASLEIWPDAPHLDTTFEFSAGGSTYNAIGRFVLGLRHDFDHVGQIADIVRQQAAVERTLEAA